MKYLPVLCLFFAIAACRKEEGIWDKLTPQERAALEERASLNCISDEQRDIEDMIAESTKQLVDFRRLDTWDIINSKDSTSLTTNKIHVFKITTAAVYFVYRQSDSSGDFTKFIKVPLSQNSEQFLDLQRKKCAVVITSPSVDPRYTSASLGPSVFTGSYEKARVPVDDNTYYIETQSFTYSKTFPAVFGILSKTRVKKTYNDSNDSLKTTETFKWEIKRVNDISSLSTNYLDGTFAAPRYCIAKYIPETVGPPAKKAYYPLPVLDENALNCTSDLGGPDANGDGVSDFVPAVDLI